MPTPKLGPGDDLDEVTLHFHLRLTEGVRQGHFGTAILNDENAVLVGWGFDNLDLPPGTHELVLTMPTLPLRPGTYNVLCSLFDGGNNLTGGELLDQWHAVPPLIVDARPRSHAQDRWAGVLNIPANLQVCHAASPGRKPPGEE